MEHKFNYLWNLKDANFTKDKGTVFSCFACAGGSTMGYKLAGFDVIGCNEIDKKVNDIYVANHHPKFNYQCDIRDLVEKAKAKELPKELYNLDVLDGSPPCKLFSMGGTREKYWGVERKFNEGQKKQVLDTLFFDFIELGNVLRPKIIIAENVKGLTQGNAKKYVRQIGEDLYQAGYDCLMFLLDSKKMGVPQRRERTIFICIRQDLKNNIPKEGLFDSPAINMNFKEPEIKYGLFADTNDEYKLPPSYYRLWKERIYGDRSLEDASLRIDGKNNMFAVQYCYKDRVLPTITAKQEGTISFFKPSFLSDREVTIGSSFPLDFNYLGSRANYVCGMSVPPIMMAQIASRVYEEWLSKI